MKYTHVQQHDSTDCAAACLAMVCLYYKKETTITRLRDVMGTDIKGTNLLGLSKCADSLGFISQAVHVDTEGFLSRYTLPAIAHVITKEGLSHFVVVFQIGRRDVVIGDPAKCLTKVKIEDFLKNFTGNMLILMPGQNFKSGKLEKTGIMRRYLNLLLPQKKLFFYGILASFLITASGIILSLFYNIIYDEILPYQQENVLHTMLFIFIGICITQTAVAFVREWMMIHLSLKIDIPMMLGYFEHIYKLPMKFFSTRKTGDITTRFADAFTIKNVFTNIALTLVMDVIMAIITGTVLWHMNPALFLVIFLITAVSILLVWLFKTPYRDVNEQQMQQAATLNSQIIEGLRAVETIKGNASEDLELEHIEKEYMKFLRIGYKENMLSNTQVNISKLVTGIGNILLLYFGILQVMHGNITLGRMMAFMTLTGCFMEPVANIVKLQLTIQEANISMKRLSEIMDYAMEQEQEDDDRHFVKLDKISGTIRMDGVTFGYGSRKPVLNDVSFTIEKGQKVALVGSSGSGKSTIARLLLKYYEPQSGRISIDGVDITEYGNESLRRGISYVPQKIELFSKSIYDNIRISKADASLEEVKAAAKLASADDFIEKLPLQYQTYLEEAGNGLSGGEKQRIALARAFLKQNDFYIMDESTSNLDFATENLIFDMIYHKLSDKSMLIIAHRLSTIRGCDKILVLEQGQIIEQGTHDELLMKKGRYYQLWEMQQGNFY